MSGKGTHPTRRKHTNSKLGCINCKKKKIRCDENFPQCNNCSKSRKSVCSYLSLTEKEINKIKLAHSLRTSTNKLLNSNYRLPISNSRPQNYFDVLEFKHELTDLPVRIPDIHYPPLQFKRMSTQDIEDEDDKSGECSPVRSPGSGSPEDVRRGSRSSSFGTVGGAVSRTASGSVSGSVSASAASSAVLVPGATPGAPLPGAISLPSSFKSSKHPVKVRPYIKINEYQFTKIVNLDYIVPRIIRQSPYISLLNDLIICLGASISLTAIQKTDTNTSSLSTLCLEMHSSCTSQLKRKLKQFETMSDSVPSTVSDTHMTEMTPVLYYSYLFLSYSSLLLGFSMENYTKVNSGGIHVVQRFLKYNKGRSTSSLIRTILNTYQYQMLFIHIPGYDCKYMTEVAANLEALGKLYNTLDVQNPKLAHLKDLYTNLISFIHQQYLPTVNGPKREGSLIEYPVDTLFNLFKCWTKLYPSAAFVPISFKKTQDDLFVSDLTSTLFCYYYLVGASMRASFPFMTYLFGVNFATLQLNASKGFFEISPVVNNYKFDCKNLQDQLQRSNYYALRVYSFLRHRARIYIRNTDWSPNYFVKDLKTSRSFGNVSETPIESFAFTLVRPEHYPSVKFKDVNPGHKFTRTDETMILKLYTRNIETLKFFDEKYVLQFDYSSMALLRDYRPMSSQCETNFDPLSYGDLEFYKNDRSFILESFRG